MSRFNDRRDARPAFQRGNRSFQPRWDGRRDEEAEYNDRLPPSPARRDRNLPALYGDYNAVDNWRHSGTVEAVVDRWPPTPHPAPPRRSRPRSPTPEYVPPPAPTFLSKQVFTQNLDEQWRFLERVKRLCSQLTREEGAILSIDTEGTGSHLNEIGWCYETFAEPQSHEVHNLRVQEYTGYKFTDPKRPKRTFLGDPDCSTEFTLPRSIY
jgi:hypothetical protein